jgi:alcohol dehydrogenase
MNRKLVIGFVMVMLAALALPGCMNRGNDVRVENTAAPNFVPQSNVVAAAPETTAMPQAIAFDWTAKAPQVEERIGRISEISEDDTVLIIGGGPTGICTLLCVMLKKPKKIILCEKSPTRREFIRHNYPNVEVISPEECLPTVQDLERGGADVVIEVAGAEDTFQLAWQCARPNAIVTVVALYDKPQMLPLPDMYGKNLTFKTGGVDGCDCAEILSLIEDGKIDTTPLITHSFPLSRIEEAYRLFENKEDGVIKIAITNG